MFNYSCAHLLPDILSNWQAANILLGGKGEGERGSFSINISGQNKTEDEPLNIKLLLEYIRIETGTAARLLHLKSWHHTKMASRRSRIEMRTKLTI